MGHGLDVKDEKKKMRGMAEGCLVRLPAVPSVGVPAVCGVRVRPLSLLNDML